MYRIGAAADLSPPLPPAPVAWTRVRMDDWELIPPARTILIANIDDDQERGELVLLPENDLDPRKSLPPWQKKPVLEYRGVLLLDAITRESHRFPRVIAGSASRARFRARLRVQNVRGRKMAVVTARTRQREK